MAALGEHASWLHASFSLERSFSSSPVLKTWWFPATLHFSVLYATIELPLTCHEPAHDGWAPSVPWAISRATGKWRQHIYFSKLAAKAGSVEEVLLHAIILTIHYGVVLKWHLYLSHFIILFQPCEDVLRIYQLKHKIYSPTLFQGDDNGPLPFSSFFLPIIISCLPIKTGWVNKILQSCSRQNDPVVGLGFFYIFLPLFSAEDFMLLA